MADSPAEAELIPDDVLRAQLGLDASTSDPQLELAKLAAEAYVLRYHGQQESWPADYRLGAVKLAASLYRDALTPGVAEPFNEGNVYKRATDVEIEQLLRIGRYAVPRIG